MTPFSAIRERAEQRKGGAAALAALLPNVPGNDALAALPADRWALLVEHVRSAPERLSATLPGNHMFFVGEEGARRTVQVLQHLRQAAADLRGEISRLMA